MRRIRAELIHYSLILKLRSSFTFPYLCRGMSECHESVEIKSQIVDRFDGLVAEGTNELD